VDRRDLSGETSSLNTLRAQVRNSDKEVTDTAALNAAGHRSDSTHANRWPTILTQIISTVSTEVHNLTIGPNASSPDVKQKINEGKTIIQKLSAIKHDMSRDKPLE
jgi:hypothetical protein